jgi:hypothetical protein
MLRGQELRRIAQVPLAKNRGGITTLLHEFRERHLIAADADLRRRPERAMKAKPIRIAAGQQRRARRGANGLCDVEVSEHTAFRGKAIKVRRFESSRAQHSHIGVA